MEEQTYQHALKTPPKPNDWSQQLKGLVDMFTKP